MPVPSFDYAKLKRLFGGIVIANNGFDKAHANEEISKGAPISSPPASPSYPAEQGYTDYPMLRGAAPHACYEHEVERAWG